MFQKFIYKIKICHISIKNYKTKSLLKVIKFHLKAFHDKSHRQVIYK